MLYQAGISLVLMHGKIEESSVITENNTGFCSGSLLVLQRPLSILLVDIEVCFFALKYDSL